MILIFSSPITYDPPFTSCHPQQCQLSTTAQPAVHPELSFGQGIAEKMVPPPNFLFLSFLRCFLVLPHLARQRKNFASIERYSSECRTRLCVFRSSPFCCKTSAFRLLLPDFLAPGWVLLSSKGGNVSTFDSKYLTVIISMKKVVRIASDFLL